MNEIVEEGVSLNDWLDAELKNINESTQVIEKLPALKLEENKIYEVEIDFSKPFEKWIDPVSQVVKRIIPVKHENVRKNFWLSTKNPLYRELIEKGSKGQNTFKLIRIGQAKATRYKTIQ